MTLRSSRELQDEGWSRKVMHERKGITYDRDGPFHIPLQTPALLISTSMPSLAKFDPSSSATALCRKKARSGAVLKRDAWSEGIP